MKPIKLDESLIKSTFKLVNGYLWRKFRGCAWRPVLQVNKQRYNIVRFNSNVVKLHKIVMILKLGGNIPDGLHIDHIDNNPYNNHVDNLQLLNNRDNASKDIVYNPNGSQQVRFGIDGNTMYVGTFRKESDRELIWNATAKYCLFRQGLEQPTRDRLLELIDKGEVEAARTIFKKLVQFELAKLKLEV